MTFVFMTSKLFALSNKSALTKQQLLLEDCLALHSVEMLTGVFPENKKRNVIELSRLIHSQQDKCG